MAIHALGLLVSLFGVTRGYFACRAVGKPGTGGRARGDAVIAMVVSLIVVGMGVFLLIAGPR